MAKGRPRNPAIRRGRPAPQARALEVDDQGVVRAARQVPTSHCDARPAGIAVELIVLHNISLPPGDFGGRAIEEFFTGTLDCTRHPYFESLRGLRVSAHFLVRRNGDLVQFVPCELRAWHAGASAWNGRERCNDFSVGIELEGSDEAPFTALQYETLAALVTALRARYPIAGIAGHSEIAPGRKTDPGPHFDWSRIPR